MANVLKMMMVEAIHSLRATGLSCREIARRLGIHRETVSRHLRLGRVPVSKPASAVPDDLLRCELLPSWHLLPSLGLRHQRFSL